MRERTIAYAAIVLAIVASTTITAERAQARSAPSGVFYHDQSGTALTGANTASARQLASARLAFTVGLPTRWPAGTALRALWVMDHHTPRFAVLYYGDDGGYIACQLHESLTGANVSLNWATRKPISVSAVQGTLLQSNIGGANPVSEIVWRLHGVRYDLLGSTGTSLATILDMAASVS